MPHDLVPSLDRLQTIRVGEVPDTHPARYDGSVTGNSMTLTVRLTDTNETIGTFTLTRAGTARVFKCL